MAKIKVIDHSIETALSVREIASLFRDNITKPRGFVGLAGKVLLDWDFFTPERGDDPFASLEPVDEPTFSAGASYGLRQRSRITSFEQALQASVGGAVILNIWEQGTRRRVEIRHAGDLSPASKRCVDGVIEVMRSADPSLKETQNRGKIWG
jgi:hypothetical protein